MVNYIEVCGGCIHFETNENGYPCDHCKRLCTDYEDDFFTETNE